MTEKKYSYLYTSVDKLIYKFISSGPKGEIIKIIQFTLTEKENVYNLAFGNLLPDGTIDDTSINNNYDRNQILTTVAFAIFEFTEKYKNVFVFFSGATQARTRLYRMAISIHQKELENKFYIFGIEEINGKYVKKPFQSHKDYIGFLIKRKNTIFK